MVVDLLRLFMCFLVTHRLALSAALKKPLMGTRVDPGFVLAHANKPALLVRKLHSCVSHVEQRQAAGMS